MAESSAGIESLGDLRGKRVLVRSDLNVPLDGTTITDDGRIRASVPTITQLSDAGARVVVTAHLGRPKGAPDPAYSLEPVAGRLSEPCPALEAPIHFRPSREPARAVTSSGVSSWRTMSGSPGPGWRTAC